MGQTTSVQEDKMKKRIRQTMGSFMDFGHHLNQANEWARLCPTPKTCQLAFRIVINERISAELLPYVWRIRGNVWVEVRKIRRRNELLQTELPPADANGENHLSETIGHAKILTVRQFYYIFCFLSDVKSCAAHTVQFPAGTTSLPFFVVTISDDANTDSNFDETECQICMDKQKQVVLPCTHSFCLYCFQHWTTQSQTCPICRSKIECSEGDELWHLTSNEVEDIGSYATDLVARIYEFLEKRDKSQHSEEDIKRSAELYAAAIAVKETSFSKLVHTELFPTALPLGFPSILRNGIRVSTEYDADVMLALELASGEDQYAALKHYEQLRRDHVIAMTLAMQVEEEEDDLNEI